MSDVPSSPFVGLRPFRSDESLLFFGRRQQTAELLEHLYGTHFLALVGSSGCGKSSLIRAGLIPRLTAGFLVEARDRWTFTVMTPGEMPLARLGAEFQTTESDLREGGVDAIIERLAMSEEAASSNCLLLVDQFEELFRFAALGPRRDEAADFVNILLALAAQREFPVFVVLTMRSDFLGDCDAFYGLPEALNRSHYLVPRLTRQQRREAIEAPVRLFRQNITPQLADRVLNDIGDELDQLPVMQHALLRTWEYWAREGSAGPIDVPHYLAIGGAREALSRDAESALEGMPDEDRRLTAQLFQALTDTDASNRSVRRPVRMSELVEATGAPRERIEGIIERFREDGRSFLVLQQEAGDALIDISHEALIRQWCSLRNWAEEEAESKRIYLDLVNAVARKKALLHDADLQAALEWRRTKQSTKAWARRYDPRFEEAMAFLDTSEAESQREARARKGQLIAIFSLAIALLLGAVGVFAYASNEHKKSDLEIAHDRAIAATEQATAQAKLYESTKLLDEQQKQTKTLRGQLTNQQNQFQVQKSGLERQLTGVQDAIVKVRQSESSLILWSRAAGAPPEQIAASGALAVEALYRANDSAADYFARRQLVDVLQLLPPMPTPFSGFHKAPLLAMAADPAGKVLVTSGQDGKIIRWDRASPGQPVILSDKPDIKADALTISPDSQWVAAASGVIIRIWGGSAEQQINLDPQLIVRMLAISPDGTRLVAAVASKQPLNGTTTQPYKLWQRSPEGDWQGVIPGDSIPAAREVAFSPAGTLAIVTEKRDQGRLRSFVRLPGAKEDTPNTGDCHGLRYRGGVLLVQCPAGIARITAADRDPTPELSGSFRDYAAGTRTAVLAPAPGGNLVRVFDGAREVLRLPEPADRMAMPTNAGWIATSDRSGVVTFWQAHRGLEPPTIPYEGGSLADLTFSHDEKWLALAGRSGEVRVFDVQTRKQVARVDVKGPLLRPMFSPDGTLLGALGPDELHLIDTTKWKILDRNIKAEGAESGGAAARLSFAFKPDSDAAVTTFLLVADGARIRRFRLRPSWNPLPDIPSAGAALIYISADRQWIAAVSRQGNGEVSYWDVDSRDNTPVAVEKVKEVGKGPKAKDLSQLSPDQQAEALRQRAAAGQGWVQLWPGDDSGLSGDNRGGGWRVNGDAVTQEETGSAIPGLMTTFPENFAISRGGNWIAVNSARRISLWPWSREGLRSLACQFLPRNLTSQEWGTLKLESLGLGRYRKTCDNLPFP
jgi:WD40 repeat protein